MNLLPYRATIVVWAASINLTRTCSQGDDVAVRRAAEHPPPIAFGSWPLLGRYCWFYPIGTPWDGKSLMLGTDVFPKTVSTQISPPAVAELYALFGQFVLVLPHYAPH
jgi:hypothetical protein